MSQFEIDITAKPFESGMDLTFKLEHSLEGHCFWQKDLRMLYGRNSASYRPWIVVRPFETSKKKKINKNECPLTLLRTVAKSPEKGTRVKLNSWGHMVMTFASRPSGRAEVTALASEKLVVLQVRLLD